MDNNITTNIEQVDFFFAEQRFYSNLVKKNGKKSPKHWLMINGFKIITLCGSTRFKEYFIEEQKRLTLEGNIVISLGLFGHAGDEEALEKETKEMLVRQHLAKIDLADEIFVINVGNYIGDSTSREIEYAKEKGKNVVYLQTE